MTKQQSGHFAGGIFKRVCLCQNYFVLIQILLKCAPKGPVENKSAFIRVMLWHLTSIAWTNEDPDQHSIYAHLGTNLLSLVYGFVPSHVKESSFSAYIVEYAEIWAVLITSIYNIQYRTRRSSPLMRAFACIGLWCARIAYARIRSVANAS